MIRRGILRNFRRCIFLNGFVVLIRYFKSLQMIFVCWLSYAGKVIGMMTFKLRDANGEYIEGMSFSIPIEEVINYLESTI